MAQLFHRSMNVVARASVFGAVLGVSAVGLGVAVISRSPFRTGQFVARQQPVPFSHQHHVKGLGIDCRYCHSSVEESSFAGVPPTKTCMTCHSAIWTNAAMLQPIRDSWAMNRPIEWTRVHNLAGYVYFNHSIHVQKGVGCSTCHGNVQDMPITWQSSTLHMEWCLKCHRKPEQFIRPREEVFNMGWTPPANQIERGRKLVKDYHVLGAQQLTNCSTCHR